MKKSSLIALSVLSFIFSASFVAAQTNLETVKGVVGDWLGQVFFGNQEILSRILLAALLFMVIYSIVGTIFKGGKTINFAATLIIVILAMMFIPAEFIKVIRDQYGIMGAAILSVIPFAIMLVFTLKLGSLLAARVLWVFYVFYYFTVYLYEVFANDKGLFDPSNLLYLGAIAVGVFIFFFIKTIRDAWFKGKMSAIKESGRQVASKAELLHELQENELKKSYGKESAI